MQIVDISDDLRRPFSTYEKFLLNVDVSGECWIWTGSKFQNGQGQFNYQKTPMLARKASMCFVAGYLLPNTISVAQRCDTRMCVRPSHLYLRVGRGRPKQDVCKRGHSLNTAREYINIHGRLARSCRECTRVRYGDFKERAKAQARIGEGIGSPH